MAVCQAITPRWNGSRIGGKDSSMGWKSWVILVERVGMSTKNDCIQVPLGFLHSYGGFF